MKAAHLLMLAVIADPGACAFAYDVVKAIPNNGPEAYGLTVVLQGIELVNEHFDGEAGATFGFFETFIYDGDTVLRWDQFSDQGNDVIDPGQMASIGWTTRDESSHVKGMYWTDESGLPTWGGAIYNPTCGWQYFLDLEHLTLLFENLQSQPAIIRDLQFGVVDAPFALSELNDGNPAIVNVLEPLPGGEFILADPGVPIEIPVDRTIPQGTYALLRYEVEAANGASETTDFIQVIIVGEDSCPEDLDGDGAVGHADLGILLSAYGRDIRGDINRDGETDQTDLAILLAAWGNVCL